MSHYIMCCLREYKSGNFVQRLHGTILKLSVSWCVLKLERVLFFLRIFKILHSCISVFVRHLSVIEFQEVLMYSLPFHLRHLLLLQAVVICFPKCLSTTL